jgi:hypothetical protein
MRVMKKLLVMCALLMIGGCAAMKKDTSVCPEYRNLRCGGDTICTMDQSRGCRVCRCQAPNWNKDQPPDNPPTPPGVGPNIGD